MYFCSIKSLCSISFLATVLMFTCCQNQKEYTEEEAWNRIGRFRSANQTDSIEEALQYYIDNYSDGKYIVEANNLNKLFHQEQKQWLDILCHNCSVDAVEHFLFNHPDGFFHLSATNTIDSLTFRLAAEKQDTESLQSYLDQFPEGRYIRQARTLIDRLELGDVSADEKNAVVGTLKAHFHFLTIHSDEIESTIAPMLSSYMGKMHSTIDDVKTYMEHVHADGKTKIIEPQNIHVKKIEDDASGVVYNATFRLMEQLNPDDSLHQQVKYFHGTAVLNRYGEITSLVLE